MGRNRTPIYDYPKGDNLSLSTISKKMLGKSYQETTDNEARRVKKKYRELNKL